MTWELTIRGLDITSGTCWRRRHRRRAHSDGVIWPAESGPDLTFSFFFNSIYTIAEPIRGPITKCILSENRTSSTQRNLQNAQLFRPRSPHATTESDMTSVAPGMCVFSFDWVTRYGSKRPGVLLRKSRPTLVG